MRGPPDLKSERAALAGSPVSQKYLPCVPDNKPEALDVQAEKLRQLYCFCHATACTIAGLAFAVSR